jgi:hypothetical protein
MPTLPNWLEADLAPYDDVRRDGLTLRELVATWLPANEIGGLGQLGFVLLRPDCLLKHQAVALVDELEQVHGVRPLRLKVLSITPHLFESLYAKKLNLVAAGAWVHHLVCEQGPAAAILVWGTAQGFRSLCHRLDAIKGASLATAAGAPDDLRSRFGRQSSFHAVVHCSEDIGALLHESTLIFPWAALRDILLSARAWSHAAPPPGLPKPLRDVVLGSDAEEDQSVFQTLVRTKQRLVAAMLLNPSLVHEEGLRRLWQMMQGLQAKLERAGYREQRDALIEFAREERPYLESLMADCRGRLSGFLAADPGHGLSHAQQWPALNQAVDQLQLLYANWFLSGQSAYLADDGKMLFEVLERNDVPLSSRERALVQAGLHSDVNRDALWQGEALYPLVVRDDRPSDESPGVPSRQ